MAFLCSRPTWQSPFPILHRAPPSSLQVRGRSAQTGCKDSQKHNKFKRGGGGEGFHLQKCGGWGFFGMRGKKVDGEKRKVRDTACDRRRFWESEVLDLVLAIPLQATLKNRVPVQIGGA